MQFKTLRASEVSLFIREKRVIQNLFHSSNAWILRGLSPQLLHWIVRCNLDKPARHLLSLPVSYAKADLAEHLTLRIDPPRLTHRLHDWIRSDEDERPRHINDYFLCSGEWASALNRISDTRVYAEAMQLYDADLDYKMTDAYKTYRIGLAKGHVQTRNKTALDTAEKIELYFARFVKLFRSIQRHGIIPVAEAKKLSGMMGGKSIIRSWRTDYGETNIGVAIGASGELVALPGGQHRLAIASILNLKQIKVELRLVHRDWISSKCSALTIDSRVALLRAIEEYTTLNLRSTPAQPKK